jgi:flavin-dependent dehydrogenase
MISHAVKTIDIAGGGLAGLSLGIALRKRGVPVRVHEAMSYPKHRVCGEFISGVTQETLSYLGIEQLFAQTLLHHEATWCNAEGMLTSFHLPQAAYGISRYRLDEQLCGLLRSMGGEVMEGSRIGAEHRSREGTVGAVGRKPTTQGQWLGLKMHVRDIELRTSLEMHLGDWGYVGLAQVEDDWVNVCGLFRIRHDVRERPQDLLIEYLRRCGLVELAERLSCSHHREGSYAAVAGFSLGRQQLQSGTCSIGDAESIIPPFTGHGMSMALQSAELAVESLVAYAQGMTDWATCTQHMRASQLRHFRRRLGVAQSFHFALFDPMWRRPVEILAKNDLLPLRLLFSLTR